jgi:hypothetical protein
MSSGVGGILKLIMNDTPIKEYYPFDCSEQLSEFKNPEQNIVKFAKTCDAFREIFLYIYLPSLPNNLFWKDNVLLHLIDKIQISYNEKIILSKQYLNYLIMDELDQYSDLLLFRNIPADKRKELSKKEITLILPLKIKNFIKNPCEILLISGHHVALKMDFNLQNLVENDDHYQCNEIQYKIKTMEVFYDTDIMMDINKNFPKIFQNQIITYST